MDRLGIDRICVPPTAGVISAYGLLASDYLKYASITHKIPLAEAATLDIVERTHRLTVPPAAT